MNFRRCRHVEISSLRLFNVANSGFVMMKCFAWCLSGLFWHLCMLSVERRQEVDISVPPVWWQPWEENFANA